MMPFEMPKRQHQVIRQKIEKMNFLRNCHVTTSTKGRLRYVETLTGLRLKVNRNRSFPRRYSLVVNPSGSEYYKKRSDQVRFPILPKFDISVILAKLTVVFSK